MPSTEKSASLKTSCVSFWPKKVLADERGKPAIRRTRAVFSKGRRLSRARLSGFFSILVELFCFQCRFVDAECRPRLAALRFNFFAFVSGTLQRRAHGASGGVFCFGRTHG